MKKKLRTINLLLILMVFLTAANTVLSYQVVGLLTHMHVKFDIFEVVDKIWK